MDLDLTEDQEIFRNTLREFLKKEIAPIANDRDKQGPFTKAEAVDLLRKFKKVGIGWDPQSLNVMLQDFTLFGILSEEISRVWLSLDLFLTMNFTLSLLIVAPEKMRAKLLPRWEKGELINCNAITEPNAGSDNRAMRTTAVLDGDEYVINGQKTWVSNATIADICFLVANDEQGNQIALLIDKDESPFETRELHKLGLNAAPTGEMFFENCHVPRENNVMDMIQRQLTGEGDKTLMEGFDVPPDFGMMKLLGGMSPVSAIFCFSRSWMALAAVGVCQAALDASIQYAKEREQFGRPIGKTQLVQNMIYEMIALTETSRLLAYRALELVKRGSVESRLVSALAKGYASEAAVKVTSNAIQVHGAMGLSDELPLERYFRDARSWTIPDGTTEIQKLVVCNEALGMSAYV